jgi:hypothetical protein
MKPDGLEIWQRRLAWTKALKNADNYWDAATGISGHSMGGSRQILERVCSYCVY